MCTRFSCTSPAIRIFCAYRWSLANDPAFLHLQLLTSVDGTVSASKGLCCKNRPTLVPREVQGKQPQQTAEQALQGKRPSNRSSLRNLRSLFPSQPKRRRRGIEAVGWRELGSRRRRITRGIPCIDHDDTRPARPRMTWPNHIAIMASYAHTKSSPSSPSRGGGPGAPLRPARRLSARRRHLRASCPRTATLGPPLLCHPACRGERRGRTVDGCATGP